MMLGVVADHHACAGQALGDARVGAHLASDLKKGSSRVEALQGSEDAKREWPRAVVERQRDVAPMARAQPDVAGVGEDPLVGAQLLGCDRRGPTK